ncbi:MAG: helix-turn-helix transcriptional regulator [Tannerellaceae bacterium]|jgi:AraC-like DNA-binding protein|nr:helix-turn-helix transcriptional regulator [Tannerellaceae bacterium]
MKESLSHTNDFFNDSAVRFRYFDLGTEEKFCDLTSGMNHIVFLSGGSLWIHCNDLTPLQVNAGELFLIAKSSVFTLKPLLASSLILCSFDSLYPVHNKVVLRIYSAMLPKMDFVFSPLPIHPMLNEYLSTLQMYLQQGMDSDFLHAMKFQELFLLFEHFYRKEQMAGLLYPILGQSPDFKNQVLQHFPHVGNIDELAQKTGMSRATFDIKFKKEFGISPLQWILKEKAKHVYFSLSEPGNTLSDIMNKYNFNSSTHLNRFCRQQFGCTPSELRKRLTTID